MVGGYCIGYVLELKYFSNKNCNNFPYKKFNSKPDDYDHLQVVEHLPGLLLVLLNGGKHRQGQAHEHEAEHHGVVAERQLAAGSLKEIIHNSLGLLDPRVSAGCFESDWFAKKTGSLLIVSEDEISNF